MKERLESLKESSILTQVVPVLAFAALGYWAYRQWSKASEEAPSVGGMAMGPVANGPRRPEIVDQASIDSFPASDPPAW